MTVVVVTTSYPRHADDVAGCFVRTSVLDHLARGQRVVVVAAGDPTPFDAEEAAAHAGRLHIERVPFALAGAPDLQLFYRGGAPDCFEAHAGAAAVAAVAYGAALLRALRVCVARVQQQAQAVVVESHWLLPSALAVALVGHRGPHRAHAHSGDVALFEALPGGAALARWLMRTALVPVFASADLRARFAHLVRGSGDQATAVARAEVAPADSALLRTLQQPLVQGSRSSRASLLDGAGPRVVLAVGRLVPIKGHDRLVRAVGGLAAATRPRVVILGEGPERASLRARADRLDVDLVMPGEVSSAVVAQWLQQAHLFVHAARRLRNGRSEGTPVALREAHAAAIPIVAVASGGVAASLGAGAVAAVRLLQERDDGAVVRDLRAAIRQALVVA